MSRNSFGWNDDDLRKQFEIAKEWGWVDLFKKAGALYQFEPHILIGIGSRETGYLWATHCDGVILGDGGRGHGIMQIDDRSFPDFCRSEDWKNPELNIKKGTAVLRDKYGYLERHGYPQDQLLRGAIAAYNCGQGNVLKAYHRGNTPDYYTAHGTYSADVLARAEVFKGLLLSEAA